MPQGKLVGAVNLFAFQREVKHGSETILHNRSNPNGSQMELI